MKKIDIREVIKSEIVKETNGFLKEEEISKIMSQIDFNKDAWIEVVVENDPHRYAYITKEYEDRGVNRYSESKTKVIYGDLKPSKGFYYEYEDDEYERIVKSEFTRADFSINNRQVAITESYIDDYEEESSSNAIYVDIYIPNKVDDILEHVLDSNEYMRLINNSNNIELDKIKERPKFESYKQLIMENKKFDLYNKIRGQANEELTDEEIFRIIDRILQDMNFYADDYVENMFYDVDKTIHIKEFSDIYVKTNSKEFQELIAQDLDLDEQLRSAQEYLKQKTSLLNIIQDEEKNKKVLK